MKIDPNELRGRDIYRLMTSVVVPRPIAWVSTLSVDGVPNVAPFSYFNAVCSRPPLLSIAVGRRRGVRKDTAENASRTGELVVNVVDRANIDKMVQTSGDYPPEVDEIALAELSPVPSERVAPPRIGEAPVQMECRTREIFEISPGISDLVIAEVVLFHLSDALVMDDEHMVNPSSLDPVGRLGGSQYSFLGELCSVDRPKV